jgi:hypothetical protein
MTQTEQMEADVLATENEGGEQFLFQDKPFMCQRMPITSELAMDDSGFALKLDCAIEVRTSQFVAPLRAPANTDVIRIGEADFRIKVTSPDQFGVVIHYGLKQET